MSAPMTRKNSLTGGFRLIIAVVLTILCGASATAVLQAAPLPWIAEPAQSVLVGDHDPEPAIGDNDSGWLTGEDQNAFTTDGNVENCPSEGCKDGCYSQGLLDCYFHGRKGHWIGRADALLLWRNAPPDRPLVIVPSVAQTLNANGMDSTPAAGPRFSLLRVNTCTGHALEATYLRAANFRSIRPLPLTDPAYLLADPGVYGNAGLVFDTANANLGSRLQSFELNRHHCIGPRLRFLAGFRWIEWQEQFTLSTASLGGVTDFFHTNCYNDLYGGQIGLDASLISTPWIRFDGLVKAGAYYNNAVQSSLYTTNDPANPGTASAAVGLSPLSGAFAGEAGLTGVIPITCCVDIRLGYFGLWLSGIAQPTQQLAGQQLTPGQPEVGTINSNGGVLLQGATLGLEARY
jgi:hypothetical protein